MWLCCHCMSNHSFSPPLACLLSLLDPKPHHIPHFPSFCQTPLDFHSLFLPAGDTSFPSLFTRLEAKDQEGCGSAKSARKTTALFFFASLRRRGGFTLGIVTFALSFMSYSPKPRPVALSRQNTCAYAGRGADVSSMWEYFNILTC